MKQAMKELLGLVGIGPEDDGDADRVFLENEEIESAPEEQEVEETMERGYFEDGARMDSKGFVRHEDSTDFGGDSARQFPTFGANVTVISAGTSMFGDIRSEGAVEVRGKLKGNLEATGNVRITGKVLGDVKGDSVELVNCAVQGNITATASVHIDESTIVVGDIVAADLVTDGKVKGNVQVEHTAAFQKNAVLAGNVTAALVSMSEGAKIQGTVRISEDNETNALFGDKLEI